MARLTQLASFTQPLTVVCLAGSPAIYGLCVLACVRCPICVQGRMLASPRVRMSDAHSVCSVGSLAVLGVCSSVCAAMHTSATHRAPTRRRYFESGHLPGIYLLRAAVFCVRISPMSGVQRCTGSTPFLSSSFLVHFQLLSNSF